MRITNALFYQNSKNDYQRSMQGLYGVNSQISSGMKIQNSYEDSGIFVDTMRLNYEVATLEQIKESSSKAQTFANNTDTTLNQFTDALTQFKTKLLQAASETNSQTSLDAIADELESLREHLISLGNTSINGQYLFSGSAFSTKPVTSDGSYNGNDENVEALIGSGVQLPYNITGYDLFLSKDNDYNRIVSTNVTMFNQTKLHPDVMTNDGTLSEEVYLTETDTIREMVGDSDSDSTNDPNTIFYISGKNSQGETFSEAISLSSTSKVSDLLESIGQAYGNTSTNQVVEVSLNVNGQIEIKDLTNGNAQIDFNIFGAVDRSAGAGLDGNALQNDIDDLLSQENVDIIDFISSDFVNQNTASTIVSREDIYNSGTFKVGYQLTKNDNSFATVTTALHDVMGSDVLELDINGSYYAVDGSTTVADLLGNIQTEYPGVSARIEDGQIIVDQGSFAGPLAISITARDTTASPLDGSGSAVNAFATPDTMNYSRRGFEKDGNELLGNISQIVKETNEFATSTTKLLDVSGSASLDTEQLILSGNDKDGKSFVVQIDFSNTTTGSTPDRGTTFTYTDDAGVSTKYEILNGSGEPTAADTMTYQQLMDIVSMVTSGNLPEDSDTSGDINQEEYNVAVGLSQKKVEVNLDYKGRIEILDTTKSESEIEFSMYDSSSDSYITNSEGSTLSFMANNAVIIEDPYIDFFGDLDSMIQAVREGNFRMDADNSDPRNIGIQNALARLDHLSDHVTKQHTIIGAYSNALSSAQERAELLSINVQTVRSEVIDVDMAEAYLKYQQISTSYQAMLSTVSKINSMSLLQYM